MHGCSVCVWGGGLMLLLRTPVSVLFENQDVIVMDLGFSYRTVLFVMFLMYVMLFVYLYLLSIEMSLH